jgi:hypothetical protein
MEEELFEILRTAPRSFKLKQRPVNLGKTDFSRDHRWQSKWFFGPLFKLIQTAFAAVGTIADQSLK